MNRKYTRVRKEDHVFAVANRIGVRKINYTEVNLFDPAKNRLKVSMTRAEFKERFAYEKCYTNNESFLLRKLSYEIRELNYAIDLYCGCGDIWDPNCHDAEQELKIVSKKLKNLIKQYNDQERERTDQVHNQGHSENPN